MSDQVEYAEHPKVSFTKTHLVVSKRCILSGHLYVVFMAIDDYTQWVKAGVPMINDHFPYLSSIESRFLEYGLTPEEDDHGLELDPNSRPEIGPIE